MAKVLKQESGAGIRFRCPLDEGEAIGRLNQPTQIRKTRPKKIIICMSSTHWYFLWQRPQQIMSRLSKEYNILFVDPPSQVSQAEYSTIKQELKNMKQLNSINPSLKVLSPCQITASDSTMNSSELQEHNIKLVSIQIYQALSQAQWTTAALLWIYNPQAVMLAGRLGESGVIYDCVDSFTSFSWSDPSTAIWERELAAKADLIITSAQKLYERWQSSAKPVYLIPNAADYEHFSKYRNNNTFEPWDLKTIKQPRLGFVGAIYEWLDCDLLETLASHNRAWNFVMIGPQQHNLKLPQQYHNIHWLGPRDYQTLPWYLGNIEVMLIPFLRNQTTEHANPIKLWEYLAAGKPVVATRLPEIPVLENVIWVSESYQQFADNCKSALELVANPFRQLELMTRARLVAKNNSWERRCQEICAILKEHFK